jgi:hypothetical protein
MKQARPSDAAFANLAQTAALYRARRSGLFAMALVDSSDRSACATFMRQTMSYAKAQRKRLATTEIGVTFSMPGLNGTRLPETDALLTSRVRRRSQSE